MIYSIETQNLSKTFKGGTTAVSNLNIKVKEGELYSLLGVNGAGKSTTIKMLSCLLLPTSGDALLEGHSIKKEPLKVKEITNVSTQESSVAEKLSTYENLLFIAEIYGLKKQAAINKVNEVIKEFSLEEVRNKKAGKLSGGYQRRLSIAMAIITNPRILFLDEPTLGLDVLARRELWKLILSLKGKLTIILTSHYMEEVELLADRVGIINKGLLVDEGSVKEIVDKYKAKNLEEAFVKSVGGEIEL
jgi:ABC-2 type transport system ATP-binding protein